MQLPMPSALRETLYHCDAGFWICAFKMTDSPHQSQTWDRAAIEQNHVIVWAIRFELR